MLTWIYMEMNLDYVSTNPDVYLESDSAYIRDVKSVGISETFGSPNVSDYIGDIQNNEGYLKQYYDKTHSQEVENTNYIEIFSESTGIFIRVPEDIFEFQDENTKQAYINAVDAFLNSTKGYFDFIEKYETLATFPIPTAPRVVSDELFKLLSADLRPNGVPVKPFVPNSTQLDANTPQERYFVREFGEGEDKVEMECKSIRLTGGIEVCFVDNNGDDKMDIMKGIEAQTIATVPYVLGEIAQEYPFVLAQITQELIENGETYSDLEVVENFVKDYMHNMAPVMPARKYPTNPL